MQLDYFENIKIVYERIQGDKRHLKVTVLWKQDFHYDESESISVFAEMRNDKKKSYELQRVGASNVWYTTLQIQNTLDRVYAFDNNLAIRIAQYQIREYQPSYSYAF
jgi:hypothetical protein